jgi:radical SAM protein with 4Fe4S-binding SPASM domain
LKIYVNEQLRNCFILNPEYRLRNDEKRVLLFYRRTIRPLDPKVENFIGFTHPILAILLSMFNGTRNLQDIVNEFSGFIGLSKDQTLELILPLIENEREVKVEFGEGLFFYFPINTLIPASGKAKSSSFKYSPEEFLVPQDRLDFTTRRLYKPLDAMFHLNNICSTHCVYCYVDMNQKVSCKVPFERIKEIVHEARDIGMRSFTLSGGEVFTYKYWRQLLRELVDNGFDPSITTKYPLDEKKVKELKDIGIGTILFSLDTIDKNEMVQMLRVKEGYHSLILKTLALLDANDFEIRITGQITSINQDSVGLDYFKYLSQYKNVAIIHLRVPRLSRYPKGVEYKDICPSKPALLRIEEEVRSWNVDPGNLVKVDFMSYQEEHHYFGCSDAEKEARFLKRGQCSANIYNFQILPDGKVTICDGFYYHPRFLIGDLMTQGIREIWNSPAARSLYYLSRESVSDQSACKTCNQFDSCHQGKGSCWKLAMEAYGNDKWDWPDPRCPKAPEPVNKFWI